MQQSLQRRGAWACRQPRPRVPAEGSPRASSTGGASAGAGALPVCGASIHVTFGLEVEPPLTWHALLQLILADAAAHPPAAAGIGRTADDAEYAADDASAERDASLRDLLLRPLPAVAAAPPPTTRRACPDGEATKRRRVADAAQPATWSDLLQAALVVWKGEAAGLRAAATPHAAASDATIASRCRALLRSARPRADEALRLLYSGEARAQLGWIDEPAEAPPPSASPSRRQPAIAPADGESGALSTELLTLLSSLADAVDAQRAARSARKQRRILRDLLDARAVATKALLLAHGETPPAR